MFVSLLVLGLGAEPAEEVLLQVRVRIDGILRIAVVVAVEQLEEVAEDLRAVAAVDLLDHEELRRRMIALLAFRHLPPRQLVGLRERLRDELVDDALSLRNVFAFLNARCSSGRSGFQRPDFGLVIRIGVLHCRLVASDERRVVAVRMECHADRVGILLILDNLVRMERLASAAGAVEDALERLVIHVYSHGSAKQLFLCL